MIAAIRPTDWNWLLLGHLAFAFALVSGVITVVLVSLAAGRSGRLEVPLLRAIAFRTNLVVVLPGFIGVHIFGDLLASREYDGHEPTWLGIAFGLTDGSLIIAGSTVPLKVGQQRDVAPYLQLPEGEHPWPANLPSGRLGVWVTQRKVVMSPEIRAT